MYWWLSVNYGIIIKLFFQHLEDQIFQLTSPQIKGSKVNSDRTWDEAIRLTNFIDLKIKKMEKYGKLTNKSNNFC